MKKWNRALLVILIICLFGAILTFKDLLAGFFLNGNFVFNFSFLSYVGVVFFVLTIILGIIFYVKFLRLQSFGNFIFFVTLPITLFFMAFAYFLLIVSSQNNQNLNLVAVTLGINENAGNIYWWFLALAISYLIIMFFSFLFLTLPLKKMQKATSRLSDGIINGSVIIGGTKQFQDIEYSLNRINENYKEQAKELKETNLEVEKFIPKQFLKYFGANNILDLQLGHQVQKEVTTMFCDIRNSLAISSSVSLEENFNFINAYLNLISPLIRRYNGFVDKYLGDGIMAVFKKPEHAIECSKAIFSAIADKNFALKKIPSMKVGISINTAEVAFGVVGEENRKSLTILSDGVSLTGKMQGVNKFFGTHVIFSKRTLNALPYGYLINYRYIGSIKNEDPNENFNVFEDVDIYLRMKREKLISQKNAFEQAVRLYDGGDYFSAKTKFENILKKNKDDKVCYVYYNLCEEKIKLEKY